MKQKYAPRVQHSIYKDGWKDALHAVGNIIEEVAFRSEQGHLISVEVLEKRLAKLVPDR